MAYAEGIFEVSRAGVTRSDHLAWSRARDADFSTDADVRERLNNADLIIKVTDKSVFVAGDYECASKICSALYTNGPTRKLTAANDEIAQKLKGAFAYASARFHLSEDFSLAARFGFAAQRDFGLQMRLAA